MWRHRARGRVQCETAGSRQTDEDTDAADVPTARTGATPRQTSSGTVMLPPPMPTTDDTAPIPAPAADSQGPRGTASAPSSVR